MAEEGAGGDVDSPADVPETESEALLQVAHGAVVTGGGVSVRHAMNIWIEAVLTRGLRPELYGVYAFGWRIARMALRFANLGSHVTILRDVPAFGDEPDRQGRTLGLAYLTTAAAASVIAALLFVFSPQINAATVEHPQFPAVMRLFAVLLVASAFLKLHSSWLKAAMAANGEVLLSKVLRPGVRLCAALAAVTLGYSVVGVVGALAVALGALALGAYPVVRSVTGLRPSYGGLRSEAANFYDHAIPSAVGNVGSLLRGRVDVLLIGVLLTATAAGIYNVVLVLVGVVRIPLSAFNQLFPAVASDLYSDDEIAALDAVYTTVTRLVVTATIPLVAVMLVFGESLLGVFGPAYTRGYPLLVVFLVGRFVGNAVGATGFLMSMTSHQYALMVLEWLLAGLNVTLTYLFVVEFGLVGAALGTSVAIAFQNSLQLALLYRFEGLWPIDASFLKPLAAGAAMVGVMAVVREALAGVSGVGAAVVAGVIVFLVALVVLGVDPRDRLVVAGLADRYATRIAGLR
jgi:O-antigen/teichoic acid export membrane protein